MLKKFVFPIFFMLIVCLIIASLLPQEVAHRFFYRAIWFKVLGAMLSIGLFGATVNFLKRKFFAFALICSGILLILLGGLLTSFFGEEGFIEIKEGQTVNGAWIEDDLFWPFDFSVSLKDFSVEFYPRERKGMMFIKGYKTTLTISKDGNLLQEGVIEVNKPLKFERFWFYQYGYDPDFPNQTLLQVVKDPGLPLVYGGYLFLLLGMLFSFKRIFFIPRLTQIIKANKIGVNKI